MLMASAGMVLIAVGVFFGLAYRKQAGSVDLAWRAYRQGRFQQAARLVERSGKVRSRDNKRMLASAYINSGRPAKAESILKQLLDKPESDTDAAATLFLAAAVARDRGDYRQVEHLLIRAIDLDPRVQYRQALAELYVRAGLHLQAIPILQELLQSFPQDVSVDHLKARLAKEYRLMGQDDRAEQVLGTDYRREGGLIQ